MLEYLILLLICLYLGSIAIWQLVRRRFPSPTDLAMVSIIYYAIPLSLAGYFSWNPRGLVFLHPSAADPVLALQSLRYATAAIVSLQIGRLIGNAMGAPNMRFYFQISPQSEPRAQIAFVSLISLVGIGIFLFGWTEFLAGYATESFTITAAVGSAIIYFAVESLGIAFAYAFLIRKVLSKRSLTLMIILGVLCVLLVLVVRAKRLEAVTAMLPIVIVLMSNRRSIKMTTSRILIGVIFASLLITISLFRIDDNLDSFTAGYYFLSEGLYAGHSLPGITGRLETQLLDYEYGARFLTAFLGFVPRFLWEGKDDLVYAGNLALDGVSPLGATTFLAEVVLQGGMIAVGICYVGMGFVFDRLSRFETVWDAGVRSGKLPLRFVGYLIAVAIFVPHFRDGIIPPVKLALQSVVFFLILVGIRSLGRPAAAPGGASVAR